LAKCDQEIYQRGNVLVRLAVPKRAPARSKTTLSGAPTSEPIPTANLQARITQHANVVTVKKKDDTIKKEPAHPPAWLVNGVEAAGDYPGIRVLEGIVSTPVLLADGRVLQTPGYDADSGLLFVPHGEFMSIPESPSKDDALAALGSLLDLVCDFPFEQPEHRSAWVAALLTALSRHAFSGPAPLFLADANIRWSGKGKCLNVISTIVSFRNFATDPYTSDDREFAKTVTALALAGENYVPLDNVVGNLGSSVLDMVLTSTEWQGRILGESRQPRLPLNMIWFATANNAIIVGDTPRRICRIRLRSSDEVPEERTGFKYKNLIGHVRAYRCDLLAGALTILKAYIVAGKPTQSIIQWGSFESWSELICGCTVWLGLADPGLARKEASNKSDSDAVALRSLVAGWQELDPDCKGKTARQAIESLKDNPEQFPKLREALSDIFDLPFGKLPSPLKLGHRIKRFRDRIAGNLYFRGAEAHGGILKWSVREAKTLCTHPQNTMPYPNQPNHDSGGDGGVGGVVSSSHSFELTCRAIEADQGLPQGSLLFEDRQHVFAAD
jgi:putative DNA primase/helicase